MGDATAEIVGSLFGRQKLRVWGIGDVNRKSVEGTVAALYSPRGTDDFTMGTTNALICWAFGAWLY